ncbi:transglycosylase domain-containing protein [Irregularibacter muris]|uniref:Penicillin-binding protein 1A n=1 Tax=Irregularibacter muris TaxID=1796619 RepID=A0AAE3HCU7_9FIRM|nr:transglycosylase domain-containing protein [Irregularibacter muris]MCR1897801.1 transglycosylase domain-containing protein [Irregularibacter muris]
MSDDQQKNNKRKGNKKKKSGINFWRLSLIIILLVTIIGAGTVGGVVFSYIRSAEPLNKDNFVYMEPSVIVDKNGDFYQELQGKEKREVVSIEDIPDMVQKAFISIEDERFEKHKGFDIQGIGQAVLQGIKAGNLKTAGGSTITQQLIKLTHLTSEKSLKRKVQEVYLATQLERSMTKEEILGAYLNKINFAYAHGIQAASETYFRKDVADLTIAQAAVLAAIPKAPSSYKPYIIEEKEDGSFGLAYEEDGKTLIYSDKNKNRALTIIAKMKELGHINDEQYSEAQEQLKNNQFGLVEPVDPPIYSYFTDAVYDQVVNDLMEKYNYNKEEATSYLINSGLKVHATIDPKIQSVMDDNFKNDKMFPNQSSAAKQASIAKSQETGENINYTPEGAMVVIDNKTGHVVGITGGRNKERNRSLNRALQHFQPGSSTKPLTVYAPGIEEKSITLATTYDDVPIKIGSWKPKNAGGGHGGMTTVRNGLFKSTNIVAVQALEDVGVETSVQYGKKFGLDIVTEGKANDLIPSALALGGYTHGQTPLDMASAFSAFPAQGARSEPTFYTKVEDRNGNIVLENKSDKIQVISAQTAYLLTDVLKDVPRGGTTNISVPGVDIAGKTGTTNENMHAWFVGYTPNYTAAVWYGYDENKVVSKGKTYRMNIGIYGGSKPGPASMWESVMRGIHKDLKGQRFPGNPGGIVSAQVDSVSGLAPTELSAKDPRGSTIISELFISGTVPKEKDNYHVEYEVDITTNKLATEYCPAELVQSKVFIKKPDNRFPGSVKPLNANYVPKNEQDVIAPAENDFCTIHGQNSSEEIQIFAPKDRIQIGEELQLEVRGHASHGDQIKIGNIQYSSDSDAVQILDPKSGLIKGLAQGSANITAQVQFKYKTQENGEEVEKDYTRTASITINVDDAIPQELKLNNTIHKLKDNQYRVILKPSLKNYSGSFDIVLNPVNMNLNATSFSVQSGSSQTIEVDITGSKPSLLVTVGAGDQAKNWNITGFSYSAEPDKENGNNNNENDTP